MSNIEHYFENMFFYGEECELDGTMDCMANYLANTPDECTKMGELYDYSYCSWGVKREEKLL